MSMLQASKDHTSDARVAYTDIILSASMREQNSRFNVIVSSDYCRTYPRACFYKCIVDKKKNHRFYASLVKCAATENDDHVCMPETIDYSAPLSEANMPSDVGVQSRPAPQQCAPDQPLPGQQQQPCHTPRPLQSPCEHKETINTQYITGQPDGGGDPDKGLSYTDFAFDFMKGVFVWIVVVLFVLQGFEYAKQYMCGRVASMESTALALDDLSRHENADLIDIKIIEDRYTTETDNNFRILGSTKSMLDTSTSNHNNCVFYANVRFEKCRKAHETEHERRIAFCDTEVEDDSDSNFGFTSAYCTADAKSDTTSAIEKCRSVMNSSCIQTSASLEKWTIDVQEIDLRLNKSKEMSASVEQKRASLTSDNDAKRRDLETRRLMFDDMILSIYTAWPNLFSDRQCGYSKKRP